MDEMKTLVHEKALTGMGVAANVIANEVLEIVQTKYKGVIFLWFICFYLQEVIKLLILNKWKF